MLSFGSTIQSAMNSEFLIFTNKMADIYFHPEPKILSVVYNGLVEYDLFEEVIEAVNNTAKTNGVHGTLADVSRLRGSFHRLLQYMEEIGFPLLVDHGLRIQAQIISDDIIMKNLISKVNKMLASLGVETRNFEDRKEGFEWLKKAL